MNRPSKGSKSTVERDLWKFGEEDRDLGAAVMWCEILREGKGQKILRGFVMYYE